ncbi:hypothetical protein ACN083_08180 [Rothia sp. CCM 9418]|uniref:hypothetical protein n=1 Tax=Rothia sp. CCM 9418 TaxID=3402661 RepID=UPI003ADAFDA3
MTVTRRNLVKSAAWAAPVVVATAAVPAYAASPGSNPNLRWFGTSSVSHDVYDGYRPHITKSERADFGVVFQNVEPGDTFQGLQQTYWLPYDGFTFSALPGSSPKWSLLQRDYTKSTQVVDQNGGTQTVYPYTTRWLGGDKIAEEGTPAGGGTYKLPWYDFMANEGDESRWYAYRYEITAGVNNEGLTSKYGSRNGQGFKR